MAHFDIELIDISDEIENFQFHKVDVNDLHQIIEDFKEGKPFLEFKSSEGFIVLKTGYFRGIMYNAHAEPKKTVMQETMENAENIGKVDIKKKNKIYMIEE